MHRIVIVITIVFIILFYFYFLNEMGHVIIVKREIFETNTRPIYKLKFSKYFQKGFVERK